MQIALTGATGFIGRYIADHLADQGHTLRCWYRPTSNRSGFDHIGGLQWVEGGLGDRGGANELVADCDAVVHAALDRPGRGFRGAEGDLIEFVQKNLVGTLELIEAARSRNVGRFIFISTCAVHEKILEDRPLDEAHPLWATSHYGAHKGAIEKFVHSYGLGQGYPICALRPTGVYGVARPIEHSKWFDLVSAIVRGESAQCLRGGKEVHAADVAKAVGLLLTADQIAGEAFNCYDRYVSEFDVALLVRMNCIPSGLHRTVMQRSNDMSPRFRTAASWHKRQISVARWFSIEWSLVKIAKKTLLNTSRPTYRRKRLMKWSRCVVSTFHLLVNQHQAD